MPFSSTLTLLGALSGTADREGDTTDMLAWIEHRSTIWHWTQRGRHDRHVSMDSGPEHYLALVTEREMRHM